MKLTYPIYIYDKKDGEELHSVEIIDFDIFTCGNDIAESIEMAIEAISLNIFSAIEDNEDYPKSSNINNLPEKNNALKTLVLIDLEKELKGYSNKLVRKNVNIPEWLNTESEKRKINFSETLTNALLEKL